MLKLTNTSPTVTPLGGNVGALISDIDAATCEKPECIRAIRSALLKYKVVFLRDQDLTYDTQRAFADRFGTATSGHPIFAAPDKKPLAREFDSKKGIRANHWHSDLTFLAEPPAFSFLRSIVSPEKGGDTMWANGASAYAAMPRELQRFAESLRIIHSNDCDYIDATMFDSKASYIRQPFEAEHSAVQRHNETGEPYLLVGGFARYVVGYDPGTSRQILNVLQSFATQPENVIRWIWQAGDLAIWDNLATQHYAVADYGDTHRVMERIIVAGSPMFGLSGKESLTLSMGQPEE